MSRASARALGAVGLSLGCEGLPWEEKRIWHGLCSPGMAHFDHPSSTFQAVNMFDTSRILTLSLFACCTTAGLFAQDYRNDDGTPDFAIGAGLGSPFELGMMQGFRVPGGGTDTITSVSFMAGQRVGGNSSDGTPMRIAVWEDPNDDLDPSDLVLVGTITLAQMRFSTSGLFITYELDQPAVVQGAFFVGAAYQTGVTAGGRIVAVDESAAPISAKFIFNNGPNGSIDLANLNTNQQPPSVGFLPPGQLMIRPNDGSYGGPLGAEICAQSEVNSTGTKSVLSVNGNLDSATGRYRMRLTAVWVPPNASALFVVSQTFGAPVTPAGSRGSICLNGTILRIAPSLGVVDSSYTYVWEVDPLRVNGGTMSIPGLNVIAAGQTWNVQLWHRDSGPGISSDFTPGVSVTFQ